MIVVAGYAGFSSEEAAGDEVPVSSQTALQQGLMGILVILVAMES